MYSSSCDGVERAMDGVIIELRMSAGSGFGVGAVEGCACGFVIEAGRGFVWQVHKKRPFLECHFFFMGL